MFPRPPPIRALPGVNAMSSARGPRRRRACQAEGLDVAQPMIARFRVELSGSGACRSPRLPRFPARLAGSSGMSIGGKPRDCINSVLIATCAGEYTRPNMSASPATDRKSVHITPQIARNATMSRRVRRIHRPVGLVESNVGGAFSGWATLMPGFHTSHISARM